VSFFCSCGLPRKPTTLKNVAWNVTRVGGTPAKFVARVFAPDEATAIALAIKEAGVTNPALQKKLVARRA